MKGLTIIELLIAITVGILISSVVIPNLFVLVEQYRTETQIKSFEDALIKSRYLALNSGSSVTLCPMLESQCLTDWNNPITAFTDQNENKTLDADEFFHFKQSVRSDIGEWKKRNNISNSIRFTPDGHAWNSATTFLFCPNSREYNLARQVIISFQGRIRREKYLSNRGTPYASLGSLTCP